MDIDLVRVTVAAFCFWVVWDLLSRPGWRPGGMVEGAQLQLVTWPALCRIGASLSPSPSPKQILLLRNILDIYTLVRMLRLGVNSPRVIYILSLEESNLSLCEEFRVFELVEKADGKEC